jgi:Fe-S-cluster-containing dehydrogenase component/DMSO reductase anchor subunit
VTLLSSVGPVEETPIDRYLSAQADLTAVERFAQRHEADLLPRQARYYRDLIPLAEPQPGQQYRFAVDLDSCTGCKACVTACHSLNGLDEGESWRSVTVLPDSRQTVTSGCHHCLDPACLKGCPVDAYEKDPVTGIVVHLDDQCIGCSYCTLTCPYEVPVYNKKRGIVRKCDMCHGRLAAGEAPACVQACPNGAISIELVDVEAVSPGGALVAGAPPSSITVPTTVYRTARQQPVAGWSGDTRLDAGVAARPEAPVRPATAHNPLAVMLVLTQLSVGAFVVDLLLGSGAPRPFDAAVAAAAGMLALGASVLHLGRPRYFDRAVIGLRHSWLSREVVAFGAFTGLAAPYALALWQGRPLPLLGAAVAVWGLVGVGCSVMIYATTHRASWRVSSVTWKFALTTIVCGLATVLWASGVAGTPLGHERQALVAVAALMAVKVPLRGAIARRLAVHVLGGVALPAVMALTGASAVGLTLALAAVVCSELLDRMAFFTNASPPR